MSGAALCGWAIAVVIGASPLAAGAAAGEAERLTARGLVAFHAGDLPAALDLFDAAVRADPTDPYALYYRGMTRGRQGDGGGAVDDLQAALALRPDLPRAPLELGVALVEAGRDAEALPWLERGPHSPADARRAAFFRGIAQLRLGDLAAADAAFAAAADDPPLRPAAHYYQGVVAMRQGHWRTAAGLFEPLVASAPDSDLGRAAAARLAEVERHLGRRYRLNGAIALQYDSNVVLAPSDDTIDVLLGVSGQADGRAVLTAGASYALWQTEIAELAVGYDFYQTLQFQLTDYNLQDQRPSAQLVFTFWPLRAGLEARYDYYLQGVDSFLQEVYAVPWVAFYNDVAGRTDLFYRMRGRDFFMADFAELLDGFTHTVGIGQAVPLAGGAGEARLGYGYEHQDASDDAFTYDGNEVGLGLAWRLPFAVDGDLAFAYRHQNYASASEGRRDDNYYVVVGATRPLNDYFAVTAAYFFLQNDSTQTAFTYQQQIVSLGVEARY